MQRFTYPFLLLICLFLSGPTTVWANETDPPTADLNQQLGLLLPGVGVQAESARNYARQRLVAVIEQLEDLKIARKKPAKAMSLLKTAVQQEFLKQHQSLSELTEVFTQGNYDQTTASIIYALLMDHFALPYQLWVEETEIALFAFPDGENQRLSVSGSARRTAGDQERFRTAYLDLLNGLGLIQNNSWDRSPEEVFQYYYPGGGQAVNMQQAASFLCFRQALDAYQDKAWTLALEGLDRAEQLAPSRAHGVLERAVWIQLANTESSGRESLYYLWELWEDKPGEPWQTELVNRFNKAITNLPETSAWTIDSLYLSFKDHFDDYPQAQSQLKEMYFLQRARFHAQEKKHFPVMDFMDSLYQLRPQDTEVHHVIAFMLVRTLRPVREFGEGLERIEYYGKRYPFLYENLLFQDRHLYYQAEKIHHHFVKDEPGPGMALLRAFPGLTQRTGPTPNYSSWVTTAYLAASNYYFRASDYDQAHRLLLEALILAPGDDYLLHRRDLMGRYRR